MSPAYVLYTYQSIEADGESKLVCHAYTHDATGAALTQTVANNVGQELAGATAGLAFMVLLAEQLPQEA